MIRLHFKQTSLVVDGGTFALSSQMKESLNPFGSALLNDWILEPKYDVPRRAITVAWIEAVEMSGDFSRFPVSVDRPLRHL